MTDTCYFFENVSLLITHYNRSESLENLLVSFQHLNCEFGEIVVSDDGSKPEHLDRLKQLQTEYSFKLITTPQNKGLGNNINKGQDAVTKKYTLYIQEDFEPTEIFPLKFTEALSFMERDDFLDIVRFYAYLPYPYTKTFNQDFDRIVSPFFGLDYNKIYAYSDHPHLRRSSFLNKFGRYPEGIKVEKTEYKMCISFIQNHGNALFYKDFKSLLIQKNSENEPSTVNRANWRYSQKSSISLIRDIYRQFKYNSDILFMGSLKK